MMFETCCVGFSAIKPIYDIYFVAIKHVKKKIKVLKFEIDYIVIHPSLNYSSVIHFVILIHLSFSFIIISMFLIILD